MMRSVIHGLVDDFVFGGTKFQWGAWEHDDFIQCAVRQDMSIALSQPRIHFHARQIETGRAVHDGARKVMAHGPLETRRGGANRSVF